MERAEDLLGRRRDIFEWYRTTMAGINGIALNRRAAWAEPAYWMVCVEFEGIDATGRDTLIEQLGEEKVDTRPYFYPMSDMPYFVTAATPVAHDVYRRGINLPTYYDMTQGDVEEIVRRLLKVWSAFNPSGA